MVKLIKSLTVPQEVPVFLDGLRYITRIPGMVGDPIDAAFSRLDDAQRHKKDTHWTVRIFDLAAGEYVD